jgi:NADH-quinone oxidoreductase subunit M
MSEHLLSLAVASPFIAALLILPIPRARIEWVRTVALLGGLASLTFGVAAALQYDFAVGGLQMMESYPLVPSLGIHLKLAADGWGLPLLILTGLLTVAGVLASYSLVDRAKEFFILLLVLVAGVCGVFVTQDLFVFFLFYEIAVLPMYLLIGIWGSSHGVTEAGPLRFVWRFFDIGGKQYAAMKLTLMLLVGSALILVSMLAMYVTAGASSFDFEVLGSATYPKVMQLVLFPLLWLGFGTLAGVFPFHTWSPDGHASAPTAVSMLHAGVLMKLGAFGVMRIGMVMLPEGAQVWAPVVGAVAVINILYGALAAAAQKDLKYIIAYSSVSHMGVVMLGAAALNVNAWNGAIFQMCAHGVMTGMFFALVGLIYERTHSRYVPGMGGLGTAMPGVAVFFTLAGLSSLGLPGTAGFSAEFIVFLGAWESPHQWWVIPAVAGAVITAVYVLRAARSIFWGEGNPETIAKIQDAKGVQWVPLWALGIAIIALGVWPRFALDFINPATQGFLAAVLGGTP